MDYLASPHSTTRYVPVLTILERRELRKWREEAVITQMAWYHSAGQMVYSPIAHNNQGDAAFKKFLGHSPLHVTEFEHYQAWDEHMIMLADSVVVLKLPGWKKSRGVTSEVKFAQRNKKTIVFVSLLSEVREIVGPCPHQKIIEEYDAANG